MKKPAWILKINDEVIGIFESLEKAWREYYSYVTKNPMIGVHRMRVDPTSENDATDFRNFNDCKYPSEILEMLYFWACDFRECDQLVDPWKLCEKLKEAMTALEKLEDE